MTFLAPIVLTGLGAVAVPVAIHLLNKLRVQTVYWGAMRFLLESLKKNRRRLRIEELILLVLRCLMIAVLALAFARPVINPGGNGEVATGSPAAVVLLADQSASMGQSDGMHTRMDLAKAAANRFLDRLAKGSQASLFLVTDRVNQVISRPTDNLALIKHALDVAEPGDRTADFPGAVRLALDTLRPFAGVKKEIVVFTDGQASSWKGIDDIKTQLAAASDVRMRVEAFGERGEDNTAITALTAESMVPATGQLFGCVAEVSNFSSAAATGVRVTLSLNEEAPCDEAFIERIEPGGRAAVRLNVRFAQAGFQTIRAAIPPDRFPVDNQRAVAVRVVDQMRATIVEGTEAKSKQDRDGFFLANALAPVPQARRADYYLKVDAAPPSWIDGADLTRLELIALCNVRDLTPAQARKLQKYVHDGGAMIVFPGPNVDPTGYNTGSLKDLLPATLETLNDPGKNGEFAAWASGSFTHPVTSLWNDPHNGNLGTIRASKYYTLKLKTPDFAGMDAAKPQVVARYAGGEPAIAEWAVGKGRVALFSSGATSQWGNLPIHPDFVPLIERLLGYLTRRDRDSALTLLPGAVFQQTVDADSIGREFSVVRPDSKGKPRLGGKVELVNRDAVVRYRNTEKAGAYRVFISGAERPVAAFAVQMDPEESDLTAIPAARLAELNSEGNKPAAGTNAAKPSNGVRREFWGALLWLAALIALAEMILAHKFSLAR